MPRSNFLSQQPVRSDNRRPGSTEARRGRGVIEHQQVIAECIEGVDVPPPQAGCRIGNGRHLFIENLIAQALRTPDITWGSGKPNFKIADSAEHVIVVALKRRAGMAKHDRRSITAAWL
jgi:hypothetical protein